MSTIVVTGADEAFAPLLMDLIDSLNASDEKPFDAIGVLDVGLSAETLEKLRPKVSQIVEPEWDFAIDPTLQETKPHLRAILSRPFLPKYFPDYSTFLWMDADTWVQEGFALTWLVRASANEAMALVPHSDRSYTIPEKALQWRRLRLNAYFPGPLPPGLALKSYNAGVFCLDAKAAHWRVWAHYLGVALRNSPTTISDQTVLNYALAKHNLRIHPLPALCNWCCHLAVPRLIDGVLCEPYIPNTPIGVIHLSGISEKDHEVKYRLGGRLETLSLRYPGRRSEERAPVS